MVHRSRITSNMVELKVNMYHLLCYLLILSFIVLNCNTLTCRSEGGPKEEDLKAVYMTCLKKQEEKNSSDSRGFQDDQDKKESRGRFNHRSDWSNKDLRSRDDGEEEGDTRIGNSGRRNGGRDDRMNGRDNRHGRRGERPEYRDDDRAGDRDGSLSGNGDRMDGRGYMDRNFNMGKNNRFGEDFFNDRYNFHQDDEFSRGRPLFPGFPSTTETNRRFKRSKRTQTNSGQRSQYNPNIKKPSEDDETDQEDDKNSSNSTNDADGKACALHCFMEELEMTNENGMPDKYLVTHAITKDVKNEDLRDFLQESIEECFQILDNENNEDKCEFSKNLMMCLSEKGRANCDDWKDDLKF